MSIVKTPAVVLKSDNYRESSKLITLYTQTHGKVRTIAKGVRNTKTRWGGALQSMAYLEAVFYFKENRTLYLLSGAEYIKTFRSIFDNEKKIELGLTIIELVNKAVMENQQNTAIFELLVETLQNLDNATKNFVNVLFKYEFMIAQLLGFEIDIGSLKKMSSHFPEKSIESDFHMLYNYGGRHGNSGNSVVMDKPFMLTGDEISMLETLSSRNFDEVTEFNISRPTVKVFDRFFENYFHNHFDNLKYSVTKRVFNSKEM
jgi:DNA repair protein RecO